MANIADNTSTNETPVAKVRKPRAEKTPVTKTSQTTETVPAAAKSPVLYAVSDMKELSLAEADKNIKAIRSTGTKLRKLAHMTAIGIMLHWQKHGDWTKLVDLRNAIADTMSKRMADGFQDWVKAFSSLEYNKETGKFQSAKGAVKGERLFNLTGNSEAQPDTLASKGSLNQPFYDGSFGDALEHKFDFDTAFKAFYARVKRELKRKEDAIAAKQKREAKLISVEDEHMKRLETVAKALHITLEDEKAAA